MFGARSPSRRTLRRSEPLLESLGVLAFYREDFQSAATFYEESLMLWRALDDARMIGSTAREFRRSCAVPAGSESGERALS